MAKKKPSKKEIQEARFANFFAGRGDGWEAPLERLAREQSENNFANVEHGFQTTEIDEEPETVEDEGLFADDGMGKPIANIVESLKAGVNNMTAGVVSLGADPEAAPGWQGKVVRAIDEEVTEAFPSAAKYRDSIRAELLDYATSLQTAASQQRKGVDAYVQSQPDTIIRDLYQAEADVASSPSSLLSIIGGPASGAIAATDVYGQEYRAARQAGLTGEEARDIAGKKAGIEGIISSIPAGKLLAGVKGYLGKKLGREAAEQVTREVIKSDSRVILERIAKTAVGEGIEETVTEAGQLGVDALVADDEDASANARAYAAKSLEGWQEQLKRAGLAGFIGGTNFGGLASLDVAAEAGRRTADLRRRKDEAVAVNDKKDAIQQAAQSAQAQFENASDPNALNLQPVSEQIENLQPAATTAPKSKAPKGPVTAQDLLNEFDGLKQESDTEVNPRGLETVYDALIKRSGSADAKTIHKLLEDGNVRLVQSESDIPASAKAVAGAKGFYDGKTTYIVAGKIDPDNAIGDMLSVAAHELKHAADVSGNLTSKGAIRNFIGDEANKRLVTKIEALAKSDPNIADLVEHVKKVAPDHYELELPAYFINESLDNPKGILKSRVLQDVVSAVRTAAKNTLGIKDVNVNDVGYMARQLVKEVAVQGKPLTGTTDGLQDGLGMILGKQAIDFEQAKYDRKTYQSKDGNEKFLISDSASKIKLDTAPQLFEKKEVTLDKVLDHPELYGNYPFVQKLWVKVEPNTEADAFYRNGKIHVGLGHVVSLKRALSGTTVTRSDIPKGWEGVEGDPETVIKSFRNLLLHEVQHAVQDYEDHARGGNSDEFKTAEDREIQRDFEYRRQVLERDIQDLARPEKLTELPQNDYEEAMASIHAFKSGELSLVDHAEELVNALTKAADGKPSFKVRMLQKSIDKYLELEQKNEEILDRTRDQYHRLHGEAEARFTEYNADLTDDELDKNPEDPNAFYGLDVPINKTDVRFNDGTKSSASEGLAFKPRDYKIGERGWPEAKRVFERLFVPGGFLDSTLKEIMLYASHLPAANMAEATKLGNDMLTAIDKAAAIMSGHKSGDAFKKARQRIRVDLGKEIERIDKLETKAERNAALDALDRNPKFKDIGSTVRKIRDMKMNLTRQIIELRARDPKPLSEKEQAVYKKMIENAERYTTRAYLATYNSDIGYEYGKNLLKRFKQDPKSLEGKIVQRALDFLVSKELVIPSVADLNKLGNSKLRRMYENWIGDASKFKGDEGRAKMILELSAIPKKTKEEIDAKAMDVVKDMLGQNKSKGTSARFYSIGAKQNRTILETRTDIPEELRALMGEITDPFLREAISLQRMINLQAKTKLLTEVFEQGKANGWWSETKTDDHEVQLKDVSYGPMNGKWISRDAVDALTGNLISLESTDKMLADAVHNPTALSQWLAGKSVRMLTAASRVQKTYRIVFSLAQMAFNFGGSFLTVTLNGIANPKTAAKGMHDAFVVLASEINSRALNDSTLPTIKEIIRAGVIDSATVGEFKSQAYQKITEQIEKLNPDQPGYIAMAGKILANALLAQGSVPNAMRQVYAFMDVWTKVATYHDRKNFLTKFKEFEGNDWTEEYIQRRAGYEASGTNISYERAIPIAKIIEKNFPLGMFLTYFTEVPRTIGMSFLQAYNDAEMAVKAKDPKAKALATVKASTRLAGTIAVTAGVIGATMKSIEDEDEEERKRRSLMAPYIQNKALLPIGKDENGDDVYFEMNRFDPYGPFNEMMVAILMAPSDKKAEAIVEQVKGLFVPARGAIAGFRTIWDATVGAAVESADMAPQRTILERNDPKMFTKIKRWASFGDLGENFVSMAEQLWLPASVQPALDKKGRIAEPVHGEIDKVPNALGYRAYVANPDEGFSFRVRDYENALKSLSAERAELLRDAPNMDRETIVDVISDLRSKEYEAFVALRDSYEGYLAYDRSIADAAKQIENKKLFTQIRYNRFESKMTSGEALRKWAKQQVKEGKDRDEVRATFDLMLQAYEEADSIEENE